MYIGTAVPSEVELASTTHHFIQNKSIFDKYSVGDFEKEALEKLDELFAKNNIQIMVGGSGLYVDAVLKGFDEFPDIDEDIRWALEKDFAEIPRDEHGFRQGEFRVTITWSNEDVWLV